MTERLYYADSYLKEIQTTATAQDSGFRVVLEKTIFYPTSGGQPHDLGTLNGIPVMDVVDEGESIVHVLAQPVTVSDVCARIDWQRRYDHMQQHTGQHLLSAVFEELCQIPTLSFHMGAESSNVELGTKQLTNRQIEDVMRRATELARTNVGIGISLEDAAEAQGLRKASEREGIIRIIEIPGADRSACGGTHVATLAEVLPLQIRESEKVRGNVRISFVCGDRAVKQARRDFETLSRIAQKVGTSLDKAASQVEAMQARLGDAEKENQRLESAAAARAGLDLYTGTAPDEEGVRRLVKCLPQLDESHRQQAKAYASQPKAVLLMHGPAGLLLACSADSGVNAGEVLKRALARFGARGGGSATLAQGSLPDAAIVEGLVQELRLEPFTC